MMPRRRLRIERGDLVFGCATRGRDVEFGQWIDAIEAPTTLAVRLREQVELLRLFASRRRLSHPAGQGPLGDFRRQLLDAAWHIT
jgi:hypothetical protein